MVTTIKNPTTGEVLPQMTMYRYDQLNRLKNMKAFADFDFSNNEWNYSSYDGRYFNEFTYDGNGNIETAVANNAKGDVIDNQIYNYVKEGYNKQNNRLYCIADDAAITSGKDLPSGQDKFDYEDLLNNNYRYNELGELVYDEQMGIDKIIWGNNGKIRTVTHTEASGKYNLKFDYNHTGKRIAKHVYNQNNTLLRSEYYTRDASDNVMAVYRLEVNEQNQEVSYRLRERHIYGSSMLGIDRLELELIDPIAPNNTLNHIVGLKSYTGSNHLGNVLTTFSDKKLPVDANSDGMIDYYQPHIISSSDYAPFGAQLAERSFFSETYPNSFNDKRDDPELGDWQDYGMRMYSPWQRRFPTPDPLIVYGQEYPWYSPYQFAGNKPIWAVDLDGLEELFVNNPNAYKSATYFLKVISQDEVLKKTLYSDITKPELKDKVYVYFGVANLQAANGYTYSDGNLTEMAKRGHSEDNYIFQSLGISKEEFIKRKEQGIKQVAILVDNVMPSKRQVKTSAHEINLHLKNRIKGIAKSIEEEHKEGYKPYYKNTGADAYYTPDDSDVPDSSKQGKINALVDTAAGKVEEGKN